MKNLLLYILLIFVFTANVIAQNIEFKKVNFEDKTAFNQALDNLLEGKDYFTDGNYFKALDLFLKANELNPNNAELNYKIGVCYLKTIHKKKALTFFEKSYKLDSLYSKDVHYVLGHANQYLLNFDKAIAEYKIYLLNNLNSEQIKKAEKRIEECKTGIDLVANPIKGKIYNIKTVNSKYADFSPMINADESILVFTSRRKETTGGKIDDFDSRYFEDIYISRKENGEWSKPENISGNLNTNKHDANVGMTLDGQVLYIYRSNKNNGDVYECKLEGDVWTSPVPLPEPINSKYKEMSISMSYDGQKIYFVSDRPNGMGGRDIYSCLKKDDGTWYDPVNLGANINTEYDEDGVFIHPDGKTLYFSSKGHNTMGDYDIFKSEMDTNGNWKKPINVGYPINSPDDDIFFILNAKGDIGYFSSFREDGLGEKDIYYINFNEKDEAQVEGDLALIKGKIIDAKTKAPIGAKIEIANNTSQEVVANFTSNSKTGDYMVSLPFGIDYALTVEKNGYLFYSLNFDLTDSTKYQEIELEIGLPDTCVNSKAIMRNIFFDYGKSVLKPESERELQRVYDILAKYPTMRMEISGHTDNVSSQKFNQHLSERRAKAVASYLINKGIAASRLKTKGYAYSQPIADNETKEGRKQNRRVEFKVIGY